MKIVNSNNNWNFNDLLGEYYKKLDDRFSEKKGTIPERFPGIIKDLLVEFVEKSPSMILIKGQFRTFDHGEADVRHALIHYCKKDYLTLDELQDALDQLGNGTNPFDSKFVLMIISVRMMIKRNSIENCDDKNPEIEHHLINSDLFNEVYEWSYGWLKSWITRKLSVLCENCQKELETSIVIKKGIFYRTHFDCPNCMNRLYSQINQEEDLDPVDFIKPDFVKRFNTKPAKREARIVTVS